MHYAGLWLGLFVFSAGATCVLGPNVLSILIFPVPLGVLTARRSWRAALGLLVCAALSGAVGISMFGALAKLVGVPAMQTLTAGQMIEIAARTVFNYTLLAASGIAIGFGIGRGWTYGRIVTMTAGAMFAAVSIYMVLNWEEMNTQLDALFDYFVESVQSTAATGAVTATDEQLEALTYWKSEKSGLVVGFQFAAILMTTCFFVSFTATALRRWYADPGPIGSFRDMRPPDWLVWATIVTAVMWLIDYRYGSQGLRFVSWNMAVGLLALYTLNGFAIFLYGVNTLAPGFFLMALIVFLLINFGLVPVLSMIGLFDTWAGFRQRIDRLAEAIRNAKSGDGLT
ncbi:MAG: DUF2232 domain-containing protein [Candidatus Hydrogenedentes bacterium]|nr:DUF2232 domain-containing protein [Candidatus Hydrogenedentota bacterium]